MRMRMKMKLGMNYPTYKVYQQPASQAAKEKLLALGAECARIFHSAPEEDLRWCVEHIPFILVRWRWDADLPKSALYARQYTDLRNLDEALRLLTSYAPLTTGIAVELHNEPDIEVGGGLEAFIPWFAQQYGEFKSAWPNIPLIFPALSQGQAPPTGVRADGFGFHRYLLGPHVLYRAWVTEMGQPASFERVRWLQVMIEAARDAEAHSVYLWHSESDDPNFRDYVLSLEECQALGDWWKSKRAAQSLSTNPPDLELDLAHIHAAWGWIDKAQKDLQSAKEELETFGKG